MNESIFLFFYNLAHSSYFFDQVIIFFADTFPYIVILLTFLFLMFYKEQLGRRTSKLPEVFLIFFSGTLAWFLAYILKFLFHTARPFVLFPKIVSLFPETSYAFPSGHAAFFMAIAFALFFSHKKIGYIFIFFALLIGISRIIAGVHFPVDILGGFILGFAVAFFVKNV